MPDEEAAGTSCSDWSSRVHAAESMAVRAMAEHAACRHGRRSVTPLFSHAAHSERSGLGPAQFMSGNRRHGTMGMRRRCGHSAACFTALACPRPRLNYMKSAIARHDAVAVGTVIHAAHCGVPLPARPLGPRVASLCRPLTGCPRVLGTLVVVLWWRHTQHVVSGRITGPCESFHACRNKTTMLLMLCRQAYARRRIARLVTIPL
jgi:hypothetical protein